MRQNGTAGLDDTLMWISKISGQDGPNRRALPTGEFFHPLSLIALVLLIVNDWYLKPSLWAPALVTGKLSDFAGLLFFPLLLTALFDCVLLLLARLGMSVDFTLRRGKLLTSIALTALVFAALKLFEPANELAIDLAHSLGISARIVRDPTDLVALAVLWVSWRIGLAEIARVPLGRIELIELRHRRSGVVASHSLHDIVSAGAQASLARDLIDALDQYLAEANETNTQNVESCLAMLRDLSPKGA
jgi:hypothetical protein